MLAVAILAAYFLPTIIAVLRRANGYISSDRMCGTALVNIFAGWTVVGWIIAFAMGASTPRAQARS